MYLYIKLVLVVTNEPNPAQRSKNLLAVFEKLERISRLHNFIEERRASHSRFEGS
jgi:hypothetical protein